MSDGTKIALAVVAVGVVGYFVLTKTSQPKPSTSTVGTNTATAWVSGIVSGVGSLFKSSAPNSAPANAPLTYIAPPTGAYQTSSEAQAYADEAGGVLPTDATQADYNAGNVVYGPFAD